MLGLNEAKAKEAQANKHLSSVLESLLDYHRDQNGMLLYTLATTSNKDTNIQYIATAIADNRLLTTQQVSGTCFWSSRYQVL